MRLFSSPVTLVAASAATLSAFTLLLSAAPAANAQQPLTLSNFNGTGFGYVYGAVTQTQGATFVDLTGTGNGGAGFFYGGSLNLSSFVNGSFQLTARTLPGNQADLQIYIDTIDVGAANDYLYYYNLPASRFNGNTFTAALTAALGNPDFVLNSANNFSFVGGGTAFAPNLNQVNFIQLEGAGFQNVPLAYRIDNLAVVGAPEPSTLPLVGMGIISGMGTLGVARRRKAAKQAKQTV